MEYIQKKTQTWNICGGMSETIICNNNKKVDIHHIL